MSNNDASDPEVHHAEVIALVRYHITAEDISKTTAAYGALAADTPAGYEQVRKAIAYCRTTRVSIESKRKALAWSRTCMTSNSRSTESGASPYRSCISP